MIDREAHDHEIPGSSDRAFGWTMSAVFAVIGLWPLLGHGATRLPALAVSVAFGIAAWARPRSLGALNRVWQKLGLALGKVIGPLVMGAIFFVVVTPLGVVRRLTGADPLRRRKKPPGDSYWIERTDSTTGTMKDQF